MDRSAPIQPDYELEDVLVVSEPEQLRALGDEVRPRIVMHLRERAMTTTELADAVGLAKGTVAHHLRTLERAGLVRVVRTRRVRAITERYYGRTALLFLLNADEPMPATATTSAAAAAACQQAAHLAARWIGGDGAKLPLLQARLPQAKAERFERRLEQLAREFAAADDDAGGTEYVLAVGLFERGEAA